MAVWIDRSGWQALPPNRPSPLRDRTEFVVIHHSATPKPASLAGARAQVQAIQRDHLARPVGGGTTLLWADLAYGELAGPGVIFEGRGRAYRSGATGPAQDPVSASLCVLGNFEIDIIDDVTGDTIVAWLRSIFADYGQIPVRTDRDFNATACPGRNLINALPALIARAQEPEEGPPMPTAEEIAAAVWAHPITLAGAAYPAKDALEFVHTELVRSDLLVARVKAAVGEIGLTPAQVDAVAQRVAETIGALLIAKRIP